MNFTSSVSAQRPHVRHPSLRAQVSRCFVLLRLVVLVLAVFVLNGDSPVQAVQDSSSNKDETSTSKQVQFSDLDTYYLRNNSGDLIPVFKFTFEDFERLMRTQNSDVPMSNDLVSNYQMTSAQFSGNVNSESNLASIRLTINLLVSQSGEVEIPIGMKQWALTGPVESSVTEFALTRDSKNSLKLVFAGEQEQQYRFTFPLSCKLTSTADSQQLAVQFPHTTKTEFQLRIDRPNLTLDSTGMIGVQISKGEAWTEITARELSESSEIRWRQTTDETIRFRTKAQVTTATTLESIAVNRWQANTTLQLRPLDQSVSELVLIAPTNAKDFSVAQNGIVLSTISYEEAASKSSFISETLKDRTFLLLSLRPTSDPVELTIGYLFEPDIATDKNAFDFELTGMQVLDSVFLSGTLNLATSQRQMDTTMVSATGITPVYNRPNAKAGKTFEISRQDFSLTMTARQRPARISIAPEFTLALGGGTEGRIAILTVKYKGSIQGQFNDVLSVPLANWTRLDLKGRGIEEKDGALLLNPGERTDLTSSSATFEFSVQQIIAEDNIDLQLPIPAASPTVQLEPATLIVIPMVENREFNLDTKQSAFEVNQQMTTTSELTNSTSVQFRSKSGSESLRLKGTISLKPRIVQYSHSVDVIAPVSGMLQQSPLRIRQTIQIDIMNQPLERFWFLSKHIGPQARLAVSGADIENGIPQTIAFQSKELLINNQTWYSIEPLIRDRQLRGAFIFEWEDHALVETTPANTVDSRSDKRTSNVAILQPMVATNIEAPQLTSKTELNTWFREQTAKFSLRQRSFTTPLDGPLRFELDDQWVEASEKAVAPQKQTWLAFGNWPSITKLESWPKYPDDSQVTVEDVELQTWWKEDQRLDRLIVGIRNVDETLTLKFPSVSRPQQVLLEGKPVAFDPVQDNGTLTIQIADSRSNETASGETVSEEDNRYQILEIWISQNANSSWWHSAKANLPEFPNQQWCRNFRWRILANQNWECVSWSPQFFPGSPSNSNLRHVAMSSENGTEAWGTRRRFQQYLAANSILQDGTTQELAANQLPENGSILLINRFWIRLVSICLAFLVVSLIWATGWFRSFYLWIFVAFGFALLYAAAPLLFGQVLPFLAISSIVGIGVLLIDNFSKVRPKIVVEMDTFVGSTRTLTVSPEHSVGAESNRSHGSKKKSPNSNSGVLDTP